MSITWRLRLKQIVRSKTTQLDGDQRVLFREEKACRKMSVSRPDGRLQLLLERDRLLDFLAAFRCHVAHAKPDTDLLQKIGGRRSAGEDPHEVIWDLLLRSFYVDNHGFRFELQRIGFEEHFDLAALNAFLDALGVTLLDTHELCLAIAESDLIASLVGESHGRFDRAVAAAHDQYLLVDVMVGLDKPVHNLRQV